MPDELFLITGGGTGAKVAESFVHLCAAGLGPKRAHLLVVDADSTNGNLRRALDTAAAYGKVQPWPWSVSASFGGTFGLGRRSASVELFSTELTVSEVTSPIETTEGGGLMASVEGGSGLERVMDLLYDPSEQAAKNDDGFRARPNLGCLLLADHLRRELPEKAVPFLNALKQAGGAGAVPVVVAASVFGGTGASLLPVARGVVEGLLRAGDGGGVVGKLRWGAVMVLPHYLPAKKLGSVDPLRYMLDTANALQFYGVLQKKAAAQANGLGGPAADGQGWAFDAVYPIGSDDPARNKVVPKQGRADQSNPAYVEEVVAAAAAVDFARRPSGAAVRVFNPGEGVGALGWDHLPLGQPEGSMRPSSRFALLLHLAAFYLRPHGGAKLQRGLAAVLRLADGSPKEVAEEQWFKAVLDPWAEAVSKTYAQADADRRPRLLRDAGALRRNAGEALRAHALGYFGRLLLWAETALRSSDDNEPDLHLLDFDAQGDYVRIYGAMSDRKRAELDRLANGDEIKPTDDNALARALRTALAAFVAEHQQQKGKKNLAPEIELVTDDGRVRVRITPGKAVEGLQQENADPFAATFKKTKLTSPANPAAAPSP